MLRLKDFQKVTLEDKTIFDNHFARYPPCHSGMLFTTMVCWQNFAEYYFVYVKNHLIIYTKRKNHIQFRPPSGFFDKDIFEDVLVLAKQEGSQEALGMIDVTTKEWIQNHTKIDSFVEDRDFFDYVYLSSDLVNLAGTEYAKIRNRLNKFLKKFQYSVESITEANMSDITEFLKRWCLWKNCESDEILEHERKAILYAMDHFFDLNLNGLALRIEDRIEAIAVFEQMNPTTAVVHFEKGAPDFDGIYKAINQETAKVLEKKFTYIDRQEDLGIPGLRQAKLSYRPHHFVEIFHVEKNKM